MGKVNYVSVLENFRKKIYHGQKQEVLKIAREKKRLAKKTIKKPGRKTEKPYQKPKEVINTDELSTGQCVSVA